MKRGLGKALLALLMLVMVNGCGQNREEADLLKPAQDAGGEDESSVTLHVYNTLGENISMDQAEAYIRKTT